MNAYPFMDVDREALIDTIHSLQVDLTILADWLARERDPTLHEATVLTLAGARFQLDAYMPSVRRH